ncbi:MAG: transporter [Gammaproteobacteria bacterium]|nr:transporter [Gammaproteobacteria bacterium]MBU0801617.1 transporter [Alphaproteobacteria bacterium]
MKTKTKESALYLKQLSSEEPAARKSLHGAVCNTIARIKTKQKLALLLFLIQMPKVSHALDVDPGDYDPAPAGTTLGLIYLQHAERDTYFQDGSAVNGTRALDSDVAIVRGVRYLEYGGVLANIQLLLPFAKISTGGELDSLGDESGVGDPILASAIWLLRDMNAGRSLAITQYLHVPIGNYSKDQPINIGENRWRYVFQGGYSHRLTDKIVADIVADVTLFGDNNDYTPADFKLKQRHQYQAQAFLRYQLGEKSTIHAGYSRTWGGETHVDGVTLSGESNQKKVMIGGSYFLTSKSQLLATVGRDTSIENGLKEEARVNIRLLHIF